MRRIRNKNKNKVKTAKEKSKRPDICLSLDCRTFEEFKKEFEESKDNCQIVEWLVNGVENISGYTEEKFKEELKSVKKLCAGKKLLVNYKGDETAGNKIRRWSIGTADIIDIDAGNSEIKELVREAKHKKTKTLISYHVFDEMPARDEIATQFIKMEKSGGDILKIACFAKTEAESYAMLEAASAYIQLRDHTPIIAVAMGKEGQASRICAGDFGSVMTYACGSEPTEAGQFNAKDMSRYLDIYYERR